MLLFYYNSFTNEYAYTRLEFPGQNNSLNNNEVLLGSILPFGL